MTELSKKFLIAVAAIVFSSLLIGFWIMSIGRINELNDKIDYLDSRLAQINNNNNRTQRAIEDLENELKSLINEQGRNYFDVGYEIKSISAQSNTAAVKLFFSLKTSPSFGDVEVSFGTGSQVSSVVATKLAGGRFMAEMELEKNKDYEVSYSVVLTGVMTEKMTVINLSKELRGRFSRELSFSKVNSETCQIHFYLGNSYLKDDNLKISTAVLEVFKNNTLIKTINYKDYENESVDGYEEFTSKALIISELTDEDFVGANMTTKITITDFYGLEYVF